MAKDENGNGLAYEGDINGWSIYVMHLKGQAIFEASVNNNDPDLTIWVGKIGATFAHIHELDMGVPLTETEGRAVKGVHAAKPAEGETVPSGLYDHIDGMSIQMYVYPTLPFILVDLFVPKQ